MSQLTARTKVDVETNGAYEAPLIAVDDLGRMAGRIEPVEQTTGSAEDDANNTINGHGWLKPDLPVLEPPIDLQPRGRFEVLQRYEGVVISVEQETFWARLTNRTSFGAPDEEAEFPLEEVSSSDLQLVKDGGVFYWYIGYHDAPNGQRTRQSIIRFRRLPAILEEDLAVARKEAQRLMAKFDRAGGG